MNQNNIYMLGVNKDDKATDKECHIVPQYLKPRNPSKPFNLSIGYLALSDQSHTDYWVERTSQTQGYIIYRRVIS